MTFHTIVTVGNSCHCFRNTVLSLLYRFSLMHTYAQVNLLRLRYSLKPESLLKRPLKASQYNANVKRVTKKRASK